MKIAWFSLAAVLGTLLTGSALGQGTILFGNRSIGPDRYHAPVYLEDGTTLAEGPAFVTQLYASTAPGALTPADEPRVMGDGLWAGFVKNEIVYLPGIPGGTRVYLEMRVWEAAAGGTYEQALAAGGLTGASPQFSVLLGNAGAPPSLPADLIGLQSFSLRRILPVSFTSTPASRTVPVGAPVTLEAVAGGSPPLSYQWFKNGNPLPGATGPALDFPATATADSGTYFLRVTNPWSGADTPPAVLSVLIPPGLASQPPPQTVLSGGTLTLSAEATGSSPFQYQWRRNGEDIPGATGPTLSIPDFSTAYAGQYTVVVSNGVGSAESAPIEVTLACSLTVTLLPGGSVVQEPEGALHPPGTVVRLTAVPHAGFVFQGWTGDVTSADNPIEITLAANQEITAGFRPVNGTVYFSNLASAQGVVAPVFDIDGQTLLEGPGYAAQLYGGATPETLAAVGPQVGFGTDARAGYVVSDLSLIRAVPPVPLSGLAYVQVRAWDLAAGATYEAAWLAGGRAGTSAVIAVQTGGGGTPPAVPANLIGLQSFALQLPAAPSITEGPASLSILAGQPATLGVIAAGTPPLGFQWFKNGVELPGANGPTLDFAAAQPEDSGEYTVRVTNPWGAATSLPATLAVLIPPGVSDVVTEVAVLHGEPAELAVTPGGSAPLALQWYLGEAGNTAQPVGTGEARLFLPSVTAPAAYWVRVSNPAGHADSPTIHLSVLRWPQTISFAPIADQTFGAAPLNLAPTASSGLAVGLAVASGPATLAGNLLTLTGAGTVTVTATQPGNERYLPAEPVSRTFVVTRAPATLQLAGLQQTYNGSARVVTATTIPAGLPVEVRYDGATTAPVNAGTYAVTATVTNPNYQGSTSGSLVVSKAAVAVLLTGLEQTYNGSPRPVTATTVPAGQPVTVLYDGAATPPVNAGTYAITATVTSPNHQGAASGSLVVNKATAAVQLAGLEQTYNGSARVVTATTIPAGLPVDVTYDGAPTPPVNAGTYAVTGTINSPNHRGSASGSLVVARASQTLGFGPLADRVFGQPAFTVSATASSGLPVTFSVVSGPATLADNLVTLTGAGSVVLRARQNGSGNHLPVEADAGFNVGRAPATIQLAHLAQDYDGTPRVVTATTTPAGLAVQISYNGNPDAPVEAGLYAVLATVADPNYDGSTVDTLVVRTALTGLVFEDADGDGRKGPVEAGLAGVAVAVFGPDGITPVANLTSDGDGAFRLMVLPGTTLVIEETDPAGYASTTPNRRTVNLEGVSHVAVAFGDQRRGTISGLVFEDRNGNGQQDAGEPGLAGVSVAVDTVPPRNALTAAGGSYLFTDVPAGVYTVTETDPPGYTSTTPNQRAVTLASSGATASFGDRLAGLISGTVFEDLNGDGTQNAGEPGLTGVVVRLSGPATTREAQTDAAGGYAFTQLAPGTYEVLETDPPGFVSSTPNLRTVVINETVSATASFGDQRLGEISGVVYDDSNGNGQRDQTEPGLAGVLLTLEGNSLTLTVRTAADGSYRFAPTQAGQYTVTETDPPGFVSTTSNLRVVNVGPQSAAVASFGDQAAGQIAGAVFHDLNGNGSQDAGEPGLGGVSIALSGDGVNRTTLTVGNGEYRFEEVTPGVYTVEETDPAGFTSTTPNNRQIVLAPGGSAAASFGDQQVGTLAGRVFDDLNGNGTLEAGEPGIAGVTVTVAGDSFQATVQTGSDGSYLLSELQPGAYEVTETDPAGFTSTSPNQRTVSIAPGGAATINFGDQPLLTIVGVVFEDQNGNGRQDPGEPGIADVVVELVGSGDAVLDTRITGAAGGFSFTGLTPGGYTVRQQIPAGYTVLTLPTPGLAGPHPHGEVAEQEITLDAGGAASASFANLVIGSLTGTVFEDLDGSGSLDSGEPGLGGVEVRLRLVGSETPLASITTAGNGTFVFAGLPPQTYVVEQITPAGFRCDQAQTTETIADGSAAAVTFANQRVGAILGRVFNDEDGNGALNPGESGLGGVLLTLRLPDGTTVTTQTSGDGTYTFAGLVAGAYTVTETDPAGFFSSTPNEVAVPLAAGGAGSALFGDVARPPQPPTLSLQAAEGQPGHVTLVLTGEIGRTYVIERSAALGTWETHHTGRASNGRIELTEPVSPTQPARFFRARVAQ